MNPYFVLWILQRQEMQCYTHRRFLPWALSFPLAGGKIICLVKVKSVSLGNFRLPSLFTKLALNGKFLHTSTVSVNVLGSFGSGVRL